MQKETMTSRQALLAQEIVDPKNALLTRKALMVKAGYSPITALKDQKEIFSAQGLQRALVSLGVTPQVLLTPAAEALQATQSSWFKGKLYESDKPDYHLRMKGADQIAEFLGIKKTIIEQKSVNVNIEAGDIAHLL